ncbi:MAG TPA: FkbM family methyltransferase, partial [Terracidiphilus sp.]
DFITCVLRNSYGLASKLSDIRTIVDVGANAGFFSLAARARYPDAAIHAYEPNPRVHRILRANTAGFDVDVYPEAVGGRCGRVKLIDDGPSNQARVLVEEPGENTFEVLQVDLGTVLERAGGRIDLLKLDCEGAEWEILQPGMVWQLIRNIRLEYHLYHGESAERALRMLTDFGYRILRFEPGHEFGGVIWAAQK